MSRSWSNLGKIVFRRTYARRKGSGLETLQEAAERVIAGNVKGRNVPEEEQKELLRLMMENKAGPAGRGWWFSGAEAHGRIGGAALNNCFSGDTRFITKQGIRVLAESVGETVAVLSADGQWREATVESFGKQKLNRVTLKPAGIRSTYSTSFNVTANHRWLTERGIVTDLQEGDLIRVQPQTQTKHDEEAYSAGYIHGLVFADGTRQSTNTYRIRLCGDKIDELENLRVNAGCEVKYVAENGDPTVTLRSMVNLKEVPSEPTDPDYVLGFTHGWLRMDGSNGRGLRLFSINKEALDWFVDRAPLFGYVVTGLCANHSMITNYGERNKPLWTLTLSDESMFYRVESIEHDVKEEEVFCIVEPETHTFHLVGVIPTANCWYLNASDWNSFVLAQDLLMLGGGVGLSVEHKFTSKLPRVKKDVVITHRATKDADLIVPDSREGWCELLRRVLEAYFVTGKSFTFSTVCIRGAGELIHGFGGVASGPLDLVKLMENVGKIIGGRAGKNVRPIDAADLICAIGMMVVAGNVRRSAILIMGDAHDKLYLQAKRFDLLPLPPAYRGNANFSVVCEDIEDVHPLFWKTYESGEPFGIVNRTNIRKYGRMGEEKLDTAEGMNPCAEATLEHGEPCNLTEQALCNMDDEEEFVASSRLMQRYAKRVTMDHYHNPLSAEVIARNRRTGNGITGLLNSPLFNAYSLDRAYQAIQDEDRAYSQELGIPESIRTTVVKPSGTRSKAMDCGGYEGIPAPLSRFMIQRIRFSANDPLIPLLRAAGHRIDPDVKIDKSLDYSTMVVEFYVEAPAGAPVIDEGFDTWKQLDVLLMAHKYWADQAVSVTVYYKREEIPQIKAWLELNLRYMRSTSRGKSTFLLPKTCAPAKSSASAACLRLQCAV